MLCPLRNAALSILLASAISLISAAEMREHEANPHEIRVVGVDPTPEPDHVEIRLAFPETSEIKTRTPFKIQLRLDGFPLGVDSQFPRKHEIFNDPEGQCLHVFIDDLPYFSIDQDYVIDTLDDEENYFDQLIEFYLPYTLQPGEHVIRIFPVRSFNESLKGDGCFVADSFYYKQKKKLFSFNLQAPYITYNEPEGNYKYQKNIPILLDFYVTNCRLSKDGYKVRLTIDGKAIRTLTQWIPYYIYGLEKGKHVIQLELLDAENKVVPGDFNNFKKTIHIF